MLKREEPFEALGAQLPVLLPALVRPLLLATLVPSVGRVQHLCRAAREASTVPHQDPAHPGQAGPVVKLNLGPGRGRGLGRRLGPAGTVGTPTFSPFPVVLPVRRSGPFSFFSPFLPYKERQDRLDPKDHPASRAAPTHHGPPPPQATPVGPVVHPVRPSQPDHQREAS